MQIEKVEPTCGCIVSNDSPTELAPGATGDVSVTVNLAGQPAKDRRVAHRIGIALALELSDDGVSSFGKYFTIFSRILPARGFVSRLVTIGGTAAASGPAQLFERINRSLIHEFGGIAMSGLPERWQRADTNSPFSQMTVHDGNQLTLIPIVNSAC